jgi:hypothetical protein
MRVLFGWDGYYSFLPRYSFRKDENHITRFYHKSFRWLGVIVQWDLRDLRIKEPTEGGEDGSR